MASGYLASDWLQVEKLPIVVVTQAISVMAFVVALRFVEGIYRGSLFGLQRQVWFNGANVVFCHLAPWGSNGGSSMGFTQRFRHFFSGKH